jgi:DNA/RNA-binding domain of Phe-tRNA-synthetase-like protein
MEILRNEIENNSQNCAIGLLVMENVSNLSTESPLNPIKLELTGSLRDKYGGMTRNELKAIHPLDRYVSYYKRFGYSYHVLLQLESIVHGKEMPNGSPLVEAMFLAEIKNMLLTAGHDLEKIQMPLSLRTSSGKESYTCLSGRESTTVSGDLMISDSQGVISSILRGPDARTAISPTTRQVIYTVYAPSGIEVSLIHPHLKDIETYVLAGSDQAITKVREILFLT